MKKIKNFAVVCTIFFFLFNSREAKASPHNLLNIIVVLDTSDRISKKQHPEQIERDIGILKEITNHFENIVKDHINHSENLEYKDILNIVVQAQPKASPVPQKIMDTLTIEDPGGHRNLKDIFNDLESQKQHLLDEIPKLYEFANQHQQTGSDIWEWFKYEAEDYFFEDYQNIIICLSDGYLDFDQNIEAKRAKRTSMKVSKLRNDPHWKEKILGNEGLLPIGSDFSSYNVKFLMAGIALRSDKGSGVPYLQDFEIIKTYWTTWLKTMGIKDVDFIKQGRPVKRKIGSLIPVEGS